MWLFKFIQLFIAFVLGVFSVYAYKNLSYYIPTNSSETIIFKTENFSDWVSLLMIHLDKMVFIFLILMSIFFILYRVGKYSLKMVTRKSSTFTFEKTLGLVSLLLITDIYFYLFINIKGFLIFSFIIFLLIRYIYRSIF